MNAMNRPMPAAIAENKARGMALTISWRMPAKVSTRNATPEMKTSPSAVCQGTPIPCTTVKAKYAFRPMPGASAIG